MIGIIPPSYDSYDNTELYDSDYTIELWQGWYRWAMIVMIPPSYGSDDTTELW